MAPSPFGGRLGWGQRRHTHEVRPQLSALKSKPLYIEIVINNLFFGEGDISHRTRGQQQADQHWLVDHVVAQAPAAQHGQGAAWLG